MSIDLSGMLSKVQSKANDLKNKAMGLTPLEVKVYESTNDETWGPHGTLMQEIADATFYHADRRVVMPILLRKLECVGKQWRQCYKAMLVLEFLATRGPSQVEDEIRENLYVIKDISRNFKYHDEKRVDQGLNVRERAKKLHDLLSNYDILEAEREKAQQTRDKMNNKHEIRDRDDFRERERDTSRNERREEERRRKEQQRQEDISRMEKSSQNWKEQQTKATSITPIAGPAGMGKPRQPVQGMPKTSVPAASKDEGFTNFSSAPKPAAVEEFNPRGVTTTTTTAAVPAASEDLFGDFSQPPPQQQQQQQFDPFSAAPAQQQQQQPPQQQQFDMFQTAPAQQQQQPQQQFDPFGSAAPVQQQQQQQQQQPQQHFEMFQSAPAQQQSAQPQQQQFNAFQSAQPQQQQQQPQQQQPFNPFGDMQSSQAPASTPAPAPAAGGMDDLFGAPAASATATPTPSASKKSAEQNFLGDLAGALGGMDVGSSTRASSPKTQNTHGGKTLAQLATGPSQQQPVAGNNMYQQPNPNMMQQGMGMGMGMGMNNMNMGMQQQYNQGGQMYNQQGAFQQQQQQFQQQNQNMNGNNPFF